MSKNNNNDIKSTPEEIKKQVIKSLKKYSGTQEYRVRQLLNNLSFNLEDLESELKQCKMKCTDFAGSKKELEDILNQCNMGLDAIQYFYNTANDDGEDKYRELDLQASIQIKYHNLLVVITWIGDIKNNDDYIWVFREAHHPYYLPFPYVVSTKKYVHKHMKEFQWHTRHKLHSIISDDLFPVRRTGKTDKEQKTKYRDFCLQVLDGYQHSIEEMKKGFSEDEFAIPLIELIIPTLITSNSYLLYNKTPPDRITDLSDLSSLIYQFHPNKRIIGFREYQSIPIFLCAEMNLINDFKCLILHLLKQIMIIGQEYKEFSPFK